MDKSPTYRQNEFSILRYLPVVGHVNVMMCWYVIVFLQCVIDTEKQMLVFGTTVREQIQFAKKPFNER